MLDVFSWYAATVHADRGPAMTSKPEAQFKILKYRPAFPERFGSIQDARGCCRRFFPW